MRIFFDTEFTQLRDGELLSIGLLADDDRWLVVEVHDRDRHERASDFCKLVVLPQFGATTATAAEDDAAVGRAVAEWLGQFGVPLTMCHDHKLDWRYLEAALRAAGAWSRLERDLEAVNVAWFANSQRCLDARESFLASRRWPGQHHPLVDALGLRERWREYEREVREGETRGMPSADVSAETSGAPSTDLDAPACSDDPE